MTGEPKKPEHRVQRATAYVCSCGWKSALHMGEGAKDGALSEWHTHRDKMRAEKKTCS